MDSFTLSGAVLLVQQTLAPTLLRKLKVRIFERSFFKHLDLSAAQALATQIEHNGMLGSVFLDNAKVKELGILIEEFAG